MTCAHPRLEPAAPPSRAPKDGATEAPESAEPRPDAPEQARPTVKPLEGDAKLGAAKLLKATLLPAVTARHRAGQPLIDPADDLSLYGLFRRLVASASAIEMQMILGALAEDERAATLALAAAMHLPLPGATKEGTQP